jgi:hypothetical protein
MKDQEGYLEVAYDDKGNTVRVVLPDGTTVTTPDSYDDGYKTPELQIVRLEAFTLIYFRPAGGSGKLAVALFGARPAASLEYRPAIRTGESVVLAFDDMARLAGVTLGANLEGPIAAEIDSLAGANIVAVSSSAIYYSEYSENGVLKRHRCQGGGGHSYW